MARLRLHVVASPALEPLISAWRISRQLIAAAVKRFFTIGLRQILQLGRPRAVLEVSYLKDQGA
jgi:hypothetical protein